MMSAQFDSKDVLVASSTDLPPDVASSSHAYATRFQGPVGEFFLARQREGVERFISGYRAGTSVLDVGGGHCQLLPLYLERGFVVTIQGSDERSFIQAYDRGFRSHPQVRFLVCPLTELHAADKSFEIVSGIRMLAHVPDWPQLLSEMSRVASDRILFDYASLYTFNLLTPVLYELKKRIEATTRPYQCQSTGEVHEVLRNIGLRDVESFPQFCVPMGVHRKLGNPLLSRKLEAIADRFALTSILGTPVLVSARK